MLLGDHESYLWLLHLTLLFTSRCDEEGKLGGEILDPRSYVPNGCRYSRIRRETRLFTRKSMESMIWSMRFFFFGALLSKGKRNVSSSCPFM
jgi:hypothetical protein